MVWRLDSRPSGTSSRGRTHRTAGDNDPKQRRLSPHPLRARTTGGPSYSAQSNIWAEIAKHHRCGASIYIPGPYRFLALWFSGFTWISHVRTNWVCRILNRERLGWRSFRIYTQFYRCAHNEATANFRRNGLWFLAFNGIAILLAILRHADWRTGFDR